MLTGLLANALGWRRVDRERHQDLQDRLVFAARIDREPAGGVRLTDFQTAQLGANDKGWTTRGAPTRGPEAPIPTLPPHLRWRDYFADMRVSVALRLEPSEQTPTLEDLAVALDEPVRPLFIGRKPCLPSAPLYGGSVGAGSVIDALFQTPLEVEQAPERVRPDMAVGGGTGIPCPAQRHPYSHRPAQLGLGTARRADAGCAKAPRHGMISPPD